MIEPMTIKATQELLTENGIEKREGEQWGDYIARGLGLSDAQAQKFLEAIDEGKTVEEACTAASVASNASLAAFAERLGRALGKLRASLS